jgi:hypothetical protein
MKMFSKSQKDDNSNFPSYNPAYFSVAPTMAVKTVTTTASTKKPSDLQKVKQKPKRWNTLNP